jgi:adenine-specific DNA methylase
MTLSNIHYSENSQEERGEVDIEIVYFETAWTVPRSVNNYPMLEAIMQWKVSIVEAEPRVVKNMSNTASNQAAEKLAQRLQGMNTMA